MKRTGERAFETVIEAHLLANGYGAIAGDGFDRERAIFPDTVLAFIRKTQPRAWARLESLHGDKTGEQVLGDLCKWMDTNGALATLRHGFNPLTGQRVEDARRQYKEDRDPREPIFEFKQRTLVHLPWTRTRSS